ncbi:MAG: TetR/AcrR family transcriptional regulator [Anaerolineae bacterium]
MKTKEHILDTALTLFNQQGTGAVSTNHIAEAAGISPGNLYYHYRNKEEIIRALFERLFHLWDVKLVLPANQPITLAAIKQLIETNFEIMWQYRFVYREILTLLRHDAALHERYVGIRQRGYAGFRQAFMMLAPTADEITTTRMADIIWIISEFWLPTLESRGEAITHEQIQGGIDLMLHVLAPYISE